MAIIYLMFGGVKWITSRGDKVGVAEARKQKDIKASTVVERTPGSKRIPCKTGAAKTARFLSHWRGRTVRMS